jgi:hypothetical protein
MELEVLVVQVAVLVLLVVLVFQEHAVVTVVTV